MPVVGDRTVNAEFTPEMRGAELWLCLERVDIPLLPRAAVVSLVASAVHRTELRAEGPCLVLDLPALFAQYEVATTVSSIAVDSGFARVVCGG